MWDPLNSPFIATTHNISGFRPASHLWTYFRLLKLTPPAPVLDIVLRSHPSVTYNNQVPRLSQCACLSQALEAETAHFRNYYRRRVKSRKARRWTSKCRPLEDPRANWMRSTRARVSKSSYVHSSRRTSRHSSELCPDERARTTIMNLQKVTI